MEAHRQKSLSEGSSSIPSGGRTMPAARRRLLPSAMGLGADSSATGSWIAHGHSPAASHVPRQRCLNPVRFGQPEGDVRGPAGRVHAQLLAQPAHEGEDLVARRRHGADGHDERRRHDVMWPGLPKSAARSTIFLATAKRTSAFFRNAGVRPLSKIATTGHVVFPSSAQDELSSRSSSPVTSSATCGQFGGSEAPRPLNAARGRTMFDAERAVASRPDHHAESVPASASALDRKLLPAVAGNPRPSCWKRPAPSFTVEHRGPGGDPARCVGLHAREIAALELLVQDLCGRGV